MELSERRRRSFVSAPEREKKEMQTYRDPVGILLTNAFSLGLALLERVLVLKLGTHGRGSGGVDGVVAGGSVIELSVAVVAVVMAGW